MLEATDVYTAQWESGAEVTATLYDQIPCEDKARRIWLARRTADGREQAWVLSPHEALVISQALACIFGRVCGQGITFDLVAQDEGNKSPKVSIERLQQAGEEAGDGQGAKVG